MSYETKMDEARQLLTEHNASLAEDQRVDIDEIMGNIREGGGTSEDALAAASYEDLAACGVPNMLARLIARKFRVGVELEGGQEPDAEGGVPQNIVVEVNDDDPTKKAARLKPKQLVAEYDPENPDDAFGSRLATISKGQPFLVYDDEAALKLNVAVSQDLLQELRDGHTPRDTYKLGDTGVVRVYPVGAKPAQYFDENPVRPGQTLRSDGTSALGVPWGRLEFKVRQLIWIAAKETGEIDMTPGVQPVHATGTSRKTLARRAEQDLFDILRDKPFEEVAERFDEAAVKFRELSPGKLPDLRILKSAGDRKDRPGRPQQPFAVGNEVT